jgi:hypothetical protein
VSAAGRGLRQGQGEGPTAAYRHCNTPVLQTLVDPCYRLALQTVVTDRCYRPVYRPLLQTPFTDCNAGLQQVPPPDIGVLTPGQMFTVPLLKPLSDSRGWISSWLVAVGMKPSNACPPRKCDAGERTLHLPPPPLWVVLPRRRHRSRSMAIACSRIAWRRAECGRPRPASARLSC